MLRGLILAVLVLPTAAALSVEASRDVRNLDWVEPGVLAIGGGGLTVADVDWLHARGFRAIADFRAEHADPAAHIEAKGMAFLDMPVVSASDLNETQLAAFVAWMDEQEAAGRPAYVHCTNGWHRAATFVVAWDVARGDRSYDDAARAAILRRAGTVMRAPGAILDYEATLQEAPPLAVVLRSELPRPNLTMPVTVEVRGLGGPVADARVFVWGEESRLRLEGRTDLQGHFTFEYAPRAGLVMDHLNVRASAEGFADGADSVEVYFERPAATQGPLEVVARREGGAIVVDATRDGRPVASRIVAEGPGWSAIEASAEGRARFPAAPGDAVTVRAFAWGTLGGEAMVAAEPPPPPPALPRQEIRAEHEGSDVFAAEPTPAAPPETIAAAPREDAWAVRSAIAGMVVAGLVATYSLLAARSRSGTGSR